MATLLAPASGAAAAPGAHAAPVVDVVQVSGWIDPVVADFLLASLDRAAAAGATALVIQLDSPGSLTGTDRFDALVDRIERSPVPVAVWVGGSGAEALRDAARIVGAADVAGMAPGTRLQVGGKRVGPRVARAAGLVQLNQQEAAVLGNFIAALDGREVGGATLATATFTPQADGPPLVQLDVDTRLAKLDLAPRLMHTAASPPVAYLLLTAGLGLVLFELFTAGTGIAAGVGVVCLILSAYGLAILPTSPLGLGLLLLGAFGFAVDVQTGAPRFWTAVGVAAYGAGSVVLYRDPVSLGLLPLVGGITGMTLLMLAGLPATVRSRFSTPTIGRESMIGEAGVVVAAVAPEGVVRVREALWPARTHRATPLEVGAAVRVVAVEGASLEVAPPD